MSLSQSFQQKLLQKLSPQQIQLMKLLQVPTANLEERIKEEMEENPALEIETEGEGDEYEMSEDENNDSDNESEGEYESEEIEEPDVNEYLLDDDGEIADYKMKDDHYPEMGDDKVIPIRAEIGFQEHLMNQLGLLEFNKRDRTIAEQIIGSLDDDGYLRSDISSLVDDMAFRQGLEVSEKEVTDLLLQIQQFDPPGIAARSLQECLLLQLKRKESEGESVKQAIQILSKYFDEFSKKHYDRIQRSMGITDVQLKEIIAQIIRLNPKPGGNFSSSTQAENFIIPDFYMINNNGKLELTLNSRNAPALRIS